MLKNNYKPVKVSVEVSKVVEFEGIFSSKEIMRLFKNFDNAHGWTIPGCPLHRRPGFSLQLGASGLIHTTQSSFLFFSTSGIIYFFPRTWIQ